LNAAKVFADQLQIAAKLAGVFHTEAPYFFHDGIIHSAASSNSSGEQISGH